jgi:hypothetical protein
MPKVIPAVFFQKQLDGVKADAQKPERLELFESELREVAGGQSHLRRLTTAPPNDPCQEFLIPAFWTSPEAGTTSIGEEHHGTTDWDHNVR